jgi:hypothetical protein
VTRKSKTLTLAAAIAAGSMAMLVSCGPNVPVVPEGDGGGVTFGDAGIGVPADSNVPYDAGFNFWPPSPGPVVYWGGPVLTGTVNVYFIWYGDMNSATVQSVLNDMMNSFGATPYANIMTDYYQTLRLEGGVADASDADASDGEAGTLVPPDASDLPKTYATGNYVLAQSVTIGYTRGKSLLPGDVPGIVKDVLKAGSLPVDPNGVYFLLASPDVSESRADGTSFCGDYCGYHNSTSYLDTTITYSFVGNPDQCISGCTVPGTMGFSAYDADGAPLSPNGDWNANSMASVIIHELSEATTDPQPIDNSTWQDQNRSQEIGDMCAWRFEPVYVTDSGAPANVRWGSHDYLIQQMWVNNGDGGRCDLQR